MKLTEHFYLSEFTDSNYATRHGIKNIPSPQIMQNLQLLANGMERIRNLLGYPISISSGYRNAELNKGIGGHYKSAHLYGHAADFICPAYGSTDKIVKTIKDSDIVYDQLICEGNWVHVSFDPKMRNQTMSAVFKNGKAVYSEA